MKLLTTEWLVSDVDLIVEGYYCFTLLVHVYIEFLFLNAESRRQFELIRIRQIYVPELIIRLHNMLFTSRQMIPEYVDCSLCFIPFTYCRPISFFFFRNLSRALKLVNIVADSRYRLYDDFKGVGGRSLSDYLGAVRQAILGGLENGGSDPFRVVTAH